MCDTDNGYHLKQKYREIEPDDSHQICLDPPGCFSSTCVLCRANSLPFAAGFQSQFLLLQSPKHT